MNSLRAMSVSRSLNSFLPVDVVENMIEGPPLPVPSSHSLREFTIYSPTEPDPAQNRNNT